MKKISVVQSSIPVPVVLLIVIAIVASLPIIYTSAQEQAGTTSGTATGTADVAGSLTGFVNAVALLVGVVAPLIVSGLAYVKAKSQDPKIDKAADTAIHVGQVATAMANKALENKQHIKEVFEVGLALAPEDARKMLTQNQARIDQLNKEIEATQAQIKRLIAYIPGEANADTIKDLPRETPPPPPKVTPS
jgi:hypothetical protein